MNQIVPEFVAARTLSEAPVPVTYKAATLRGLDVFYREAGPRDAQTVLLLHGFPSSSHMFRDLIPVLAGRYHVVAPDYPGFGYSSARSPDRFDYSFATLAEVIEEFTAAIGLTDYVIYMQDYGGPVGLRLALRNPVKVRGFIVQNAVANVEGWNPDVVAKLAPAWQNRNAETEAPLRALLAADTTRFQYTHGASRVERLSPDAWAFDQALLDRPGNGSIQLELLYRYQDNVAQYPKWQDYLRLAQPPLLVVWGDNDPFFTAQGRDLYKALVPATQVLSYDAGHFALETHAAEIADAIIGFLDRLPAGR